MVALAHQAPRSSGGGCERSRSARWRRHDRVDGQGPACHADQRAGCQASSDSDGHNDSRPAHRASRHTRLQRTRIAAHKPSGAGIAKPGRIGNTESHRVGERQPDADTHADGDVQSDAVVADTQFLTHRITGCDEPVGSP